MTQLKENTKQMESAAEEAQRLGISVRTVFRHRAAAKRMIDQCGTPQDRLDTPYQQPVSESSESAWKMLVESLRDTIRHQEQEIDRMSQSIARLESTIGGQPREQVPPQPQNVQNPIIPGITGQSGNNLTMAVVSFLVGVVVMWILRM